MRSPPILAIIILLASRSSVHAFFMDMYGTAFQGELLDDCTIYVYDRVVDMQGLKHWCLTKKGNIIASGSAFGGEDFNAIIYAIYADDKNIVHIMNIGPKGDPFRLSLFSQNYFEAEANYYFNVSTTTNVPHTSTSIGTYSLWGPDRFMWNPHGVQSFYQILYHSCYDNVYVTRMVIYNVRDDTADVSSLNASCDPYVYESAINMVPTQVRIDPDHPGERYCIVGNLTFTLHPIQQSLQTVVYGYDMFKNLSESFPYLAVEIHPPTTPLVGVIIRNGTLITPEGNPLNRPPMENHYTEVPFFFVNNEGSSYSPLFLYYKYSGQLRDFTVRFINNNKLFEIFDPVRFMDSCRFEDDDVTVVAAPRVLQHDEMSFFIEAYFFLNNADLKYCVFEITYEYATKKYQILPPATFPVNAYVHVETRSNTAVNCNYGNRTVHWLLAYTEGKEAELVSLDNDVSSPIFPCPLCGPSTMMYCDMYPESAKKYYSAVYLITSKEIRFIGVKRKGYMMQIDYYTTTLTDEQYFAQPMNLTLSLHDIRQKLQTTTEEPPIEVDPVAGSNGAGGLHFLWMTLLPFVILTFLTELN